MSRIKYGTITYIGSNLSTLISGDEKYQFATSNFPKAELGLEVIFVEDYDNMTPNTKYAKDLRDLSVKNFIVKDLLERIARLEDKVLEGNRFTSGKIEDRDYSLQIMEDGTDTGT